jgi:uncharacterized coiled-coil protein SlyX
MSGFWWDAIQAGQIEELQKKVEEQDVVITEIKAILYNMALRIKSLENGNGKCEEGDSNSLSPMVETPSRLETSVLEDGTTGSKEGSKES